MSVLKFNICESILYDSLGREVLWIDSRDGCTVKHCQVTVYDDKRNVYEYQGIGFLDATYSSYRITFVNTGAWPFSTVT